MKNTPIKNENIEDNKPSYYAIITADVRYDKRLSAMAKLIFAELSALVNINGFAHPSNNFLSELYDVSKSTIIRILNQLKELGYIYTEETITSKGTFRKIFINTNPKSLENKNDLEPSVKNDIPPSVKNDTPYPITNTSYIPLQVYSRENEDTTSISKTYVHMKERSVSLSLLENLSINLNISRNVYEKFYFYYSVRNWTTSDNILITPDNVSNFLKLWNSREITSLPGKTKTAVENEPEWLDEVLDSVLQNHK